MKSKQQLYQHLTSLGLLVSPQLKKAFLAVDRQDFVRPEYRSMAYEDHPLPIGFGQSISQPFTVALMLELLNPQKDQVILDVGTGSGWTTAMLAEVVGRQGKVYSVEILPELLQYAKSNLEKYKMKNIILRPAGQRLGLTEFSPFHRILVSAEAEQLPNLLVDQLAIGGSLVLPVSGSVVKLEKISDTHLETTTFPGFAFVPLQ